MFLKLSLARAVPKLLIATEDDAEALDALTGRKKLDPRTASPRDAGPGKIQCWDPCTMDDLGTVKAFTTAEVQLCLRETGLANASHSKFPFPAKVDFPCREKI